MTTYLTSIGAPVTRPAEVARRLTASPAIETRERKVDAVLADSFPASDPPSWTLGQAPRAPLERVAAARDDAPVWSSHTTVIVAGGRRTARSWIANGLGAIGIGMIIPIGILLIGIPLALATRGVAAVAAWLGAVAFN